MAGSESERPETTRFSRKVKTLSPWVSKASGWTDLKDDGGAKRFMSAGVLHYSRGEGEPIWGPLGGGDGNI